MDQKLQKSLKIILTTITSPTCQYDADWNHFLYDFSVFDMWQINWIFSFSPLGKPADRAIYFACVNFFFFKSSKAISGSTGPIFTIFSPDGRYLCECCQSDPFFPIRQGTLPWQPILCIKKNTNHVRFLQFLHHMKAIWL